MPCRRCRSSLDPGSLFCSECGARQTADAPTGVECESHPGQEAVGLCVVCGKPVCGDCASSVEGKIICDHRDHKLLAERWTTAYVCSFSFDADMIVHNLLQSGIKARAFSFRDHIGLRWVNDSHRAHVLVPIEDQEAARELLFNLQLPDSSQLHERHRV